MKRTAFTLWTRPVLAAIQTIPVQNLDWNRDIMDGNNRWVATFGTDHQTMQMRPWGQQVLHTYTLK